MSDIKTLFDELTNNLESLKDSFKKDKANNNKDNSVESYNDFTEQFLNSFYEFVSEIDNSVDFLQSGNISNIRKTEHLLDQKLQCQEIVTEISNLFINVSDLNNSINKSLEHIGQISDVSRSYLFLVNKDQLSYSNTHEWCNIGIPPKKNEIQNIPLNAFPWIIGFLKNGENVKINDVRKLPQEAIVEKEIYLREKVMSILCFPLFIDNEFVGILGIENHETIKDWSEDNYTFMKLTSEILSRALKHQKVEDELLESKNKLLILNAKLEMEVEKRTLQLKESEDKYRLITENANDLIVVLNQNFEFEYINEPAHQRMRGISSEDRIGKPVLSIIHPEDQAESIEILKEGFNTGEGTTQLRLLNLDGTYDWFEIRGKTFIDTDGIKKGLLISRNINERKLTEDALINSEEKYRLLFESIADPIHVIDANLKIIYLNPAFKSWLKILNLDLNVIGKTPVEAFPFIGEGVYDEYINVFNTEEIHIKEERTYVNDICMYAETRKIPIIKSGSAIQIITIIRDITKQKEVEEALRVSEAKYRSFIENLKGIAFQAYEDHSADFFHGAVEELTGYKPEEFTSGTISWNQLIYPEDASKLKNEFDENQENQLEYRIKDKSGMTHWILSNSQKFYNEKKKKMGARGIFIDITDKKNAEQQLKESEEKFRTISDQSLMGIGILQDEKLKYMNRRFADIFGYPSDEFINMTFFDFLEITNQEDKEKLLKKVEESKDRIDDTITNYKFRALKKTEEQIWVDVYSRLIDYQGSRASLLIIVDITEMKKAEKIIINENKKLLELDNIRKDFLIRASHELKTPLNSIYSTLEFLMNYYSDTFDEKLEKFLEIIYKGSKRLKMLVENLLDVSRIESERIKLNSEENSLHKIIRSCIDEAHYLSENRNITIYFEKSEDIYLKFDKIRMEQVIVNILVNAIKNTPRYGEIIIKTKQEKDNITILIRDTGVGFTEEEKGKIFEKFGKIERYGQGMDIDTEGSGLGLFISKEIVELHGGKIELLSEGRNKGSIFIIQLPS